MKKKDIFYRIILTGKEHWFELFIGFLMMLLGSLVSILPTWALKLVIDVLSSGKLNYEHVTVNVVPLQLINYGLPPLTLSLKPTKILQLAPLMLPALFLLEGFIRLVHTFNTRFFGVLVADNLRKQAHYKLVSLSLPQIRAHKSGDLVSCLTNDLNSVQNLLAEVLTTIIKDSATSLALGVWLLVVDWKLSLVAITVVPFFFVSVSLLSKKIRKLANSGQIMNGKMSAFISETVQGADLMHLFQVKDVRHQKFIEQSDHFVSVWRKQMWIDAMISPILGFITAFGIGIVIWFGLSRVFNNNLTLGDFTSYIITLVLLYQPVKRLFRANSQISQMVGTCERIFNLIESTPSIPENAHTPFFTNKSEALTIELQNVSFAYPDEETEVLRGINLRIDEGDRLAIVGSSGSGKSTLIKLLPRLYEIQKGEILVNGFPIKSLNLSEVREIFSFVPQDPFLFSGTLKENLLLARPNASDKELEEALSLANVNFFNSLDDSITERGLNFSGGQRQRIGIARAFLRNSRVLILDEPTSSLDGHSEELIKQSLLELMKNRTVILITHKLSLIKDFSRVVWMQDGQILEKADWDKLEDLQNLYTTEKDSALHLIQELNSP